MTSTNKFALVRRKPSRYANKKLFAYGDGSTCIFAMDSELFPADRASYLTDLPVSNFPLFTLGSIDIFTGGTVSKWVRDGGRQALDPNGVGLTAEATDIVTSAHSIPGQSENFETRGSAISAWIKTSSSGADMCITRVGVFGGDSAGIGMHMRSGKIAVSMNYWSGIGSAYDLVETSSTFNDGEWHHVAVIDRGQGVAADMEIFVDCAKQSTSTVSDAYTPTSLMNNLIYVGAAGYTLTFGPLTLTPRDPFIGLIDDVQVFEDAISYDHLRWLGTRRGIAYDHVERRVVKIPPASTAGKTFGLVNKRASVYREWTPKDLVNLYAWYDAADESSITHSSGAVSKWNDLSGNGHDLYQATAAKKPATGSNKINSLNVLTLGNGQGLEVSAYTDVGSDGAYSYYMVRDRDANATYDMPGFTTSVGNKGAPFDRYESTHYWYGTNANAGVDLNNYNDPMQLGYVLSDEGSENRMKEYVDGTLATNHVTAAGWTVGGQKITAGFRDDEATRLVGKLGEGIFVDSIISDGDRERIEGYLAHKWGLASSLPATHPYKGNPPMVWDYLGTPKRVVRVPTAAETANQFGLVRRKPSPHANKKLFAGIDSHKLMVAFNPEDLFHQCGSDLDQIRNRGISSQTNLFRTRLAATDYVYFAPYLTTSTSCTIVRDGHRAALDCNGDGFFAGIDVGGDLGQAGKWPQNKDKGQSVFAISGWFKTTSSTANMCIAGLVGTNATLLPSGETIYMRAGKLAACIGWISAPTAATNYAMIETSATFNDGEWHHVAATWDGTNSAAGIELFVDGAKQVTSTISDNSSGQYYTATLTASIGTNSFEFQFSPAFEIWPTDGFDGLIDDVQFFENATPHSHLRWLSTRRGIAYDHVERRVVKLSEILHVTPLEEKYARQPYSKILLARSF